MAAAFSGARTAQARGLALSQARVAGALFGATPAASVGRYRVLERLGAGGMGVVYAAYDPQLDRGVALKTVEVPGQGRALALAEAQTLARLSHPNVVSVYDVGMAGDQIFIVMELVRGLTLRQWASGRRPEEILAAYRQAGAALAAAHAAGLVHRDFKPDNALVGDDGRVRVVDFGIAGTAAGGRCPGSRLLDRAGTPRYMAPEQARGAPINAAADQYSFAVSLREALGNAQGREPTPRWLAAVLDRAAAARAEDRFPSIAALLAALRRDPALRRRRWLVITSLAAAGAIATVSGWRLATDAERACSAGPARLADIWSEDKQTAAVRRLASLGPYGQALERQLGARLQVHRHQWSAAFRDACLASRSGAHSADLGDRRLICLERGRSALGAIAGLVEAAQAHTLPALARAIQALPDPTTCGDLEALAADVALPAPGLSASVAEVRTRLENARVDVVAGRFAEARTRARAAVADARRIDYRPLLAEALVVEGRATMNVDRRAAVAPLAEATRIAFEVGAQRLGLEAWARRAWAEGTSASAVSALGGLDVIEALAVRLPGSHFERALLYNNVGSVQLALERPERGRAAMLTALEQARHVTGPGAIELVNTRVGLAFTTADAGERDRLLGEAESQLTTLIGPNHPDTLELHTVRSAWSQSLPRAVAMLAPACATFERLHPDLPERIAACRMELAFLHGELGDRAASMSDLARVQALDGSLSEKAAAFLALARGQAETAMSHLSLALSRLNAAAAGAGEPHWVRLERAELQLGVARAHRQRGRLSEARQALRAALAVLVPLAEKHRAAVVQRRLARARADLAVVLGDLGQGRRERTRLAAAALAWMQPAGGQPGALHALARLASR